jgi:predicted permease
LIVYLGSWMAARAYGIEKSLRATFVQSTIHGNLGYIGLAVAYYYLGDEGLARASLIAGFIMIWQNLLAVVVLQVHIPGQAVPLTPLRVMLKIIGNPIIVSAFAGILVAWTGIDLPVFIDRILQIVSSLALPLALLIIGGSLSFHLPRGRLGPLMCSVTAKLGLLPATGLGLYVLAGVPAQDYLPALILLAAPTATVCYVMARELHGDSEFAVIAISLGTLASAVTFSIWLHWA